MRLHQIPRLPHQSHLLPHRLRQNQSNHPRRTHRLVPLWVEEVCEQLDYGCEDVEGGEGYHGGVGCGDSCWVKWVFGGDYWGDDEDLVGLDGWHYTCNVTVVRTDYWYLHAFSFPLDLSSCTGSLSSYHVCLSIIIRVHLHPVVWKARLICSEISVANWWPHIC